MITRYVDPNADVGGDGTTNAQSGAHCAYKSLSIWEAAEQQDLTAGGGNIAECIVDSNYSPHSVDSSVCVINGWTTSATCYIYIHTPTSSRHSGVWDTTKYRHAGPSTFANIAIYEDYTKIFGLQIDAVGEGNYNAVASYIVAKGITFGYNIVRYNYTGAGTKDAGVVRFDIVGGPTNYVYNNLIYNNTTGSAGTVYGLGQNYGTVYAYNNTVFGFERGIFGMSIIRNCISMGNSNYDFNNTTGSYNVSSDDSASGSPTAEDKDAYDDYFIDYTNKDFHLKNNSNTLFGLAGTDLSSLNLFTDDIDGDARVDWDIGADEYISVGGFNRAPTMFNVF
jgi:hypothetical protein